MTGNIIDKHEVGQPVIGVYFEGQAEILKSEADQTIAVEHIARRLDLDSSELISDANSEGGHQFYTISVQNWYVFDRFGADHSTKHKLEWAKSSSTG